MSKHHDVLHSPSRRGRRAAADKRRQDPAAQLRPGALLLILGAGVIATILGLVVVDLRFDARDFEIETRRLQELTQVRRDQVRVMESRLGMMKSGDALREAALGPLGMIEPTADVIERLEVSDERAQAWQEATERARDILTERRAELAERRKEVF